MWADRDYRSGRSRASLRKLSRAPREVSRKGPLPRRGRSPGRGRRCRSLHAGPRRSRAAHHCHADEQHGEGRPPAAWRGCRPGIRTPGRGVRGGGGRDKALMLRVGLTGGIGCGKSVVAAMLREQGYLVLDADTLAHQLVEPGQPAYDDVLQEFGKGVCDASGKIDRAKLAAIVFAEPAKLARLNQIVHPRVAEAQERQFTEWQRTHPRGVAVVEAALLVEAGAHNRLDRLVVVWCRPEQQIQRLRERGMSAEEAH